MSRILFAAKCQSQTQLDDVAHEQTIICRQLFAGHVEGSLPIKRKKNLPQIIMIMACSQFQVCPSAPPPPLPWAFVRNLSENLCLGVGHLSILLEVIDTAPFSKYHLKFVYLGSYVYRYIKNIFNTIICFQKRHVVFLHPSPSYLTVFFASV